MQRARWAAVVGLALVAAQARALGGGDVPQSTPVPGGPDLAQACIALMNGQAPQGMDASSLREQCTALILGSGPANASSAREAPTPGSDVRAAFEQAGGELVGRSARPPAGLGTSVRGPTRSLVTTNPLGWFSGLGVNATLSRSVASFPKLSWIASARYARANASNGNVTTVGLGTGADLFVFGRNNEGLRIGPRLDLSFGTETFRGGTTYGRLGASGELGYNFVATNGISALAAVGLGGRIVGDSQNESFTSFTGGEMSPYLKLGIGYAF